MGIPILRVRDENGNVYAIPAIQGAAGESGITPTIGSNGNWYLGSTDTGKPSRGAQGIQGEKGDKGDKGEQGIPGPAGSVDNLTAENIQSALGYTPADSADVSAKLDKPSTPPEVGKILKVTAVNEDGSFVCEWTDTPSGGGSWSQISGKPFDTIDGNTLVSRSGTLCVNTTDDAEQDNTRPITSSGVHVICGNINALLQAI